MTLGTWWTWVAALLAAVVQAGCGGAAPATGVEGSPENQPLVVQRRGPAMPPPVVLRFAARPAAIEAGGHAVLRWDVRHATAIEIDQGVGAVSGHEVAVSPTATTTYTLSASGPGGRTTAHATVTVRGNWRARAPMAARRASLATAVLDGKIYAIGGDEDFHFAWNTMEVYDPDTNTWTPRAPMIAVGRNELAVVAAGGRIYAMGGNDFSRPHGADDLQEYDPVADTWAVHAMPWQRVLHAAAALEGRIYVLGGMCYSFATDDVPCPVDVYDPASATWSTAAPLPTERTGHAAVTLRGRVYVVGGTCHASPSDPTPLPCATLAYDAASDTWEELETLPPSDVAAAVVRGRILVVDRSGTGLAAEYDPTWGTWTGLTSLPTRRAACAAAELSGEVYVLGGRTPAPDRLSLDVVEAFTPRGRHLWPRP